MDGNTIEQKYVSNDAIDKMPQTAKNPIELFVCLIILYESLKLFEKLMNSQLQKQKSTPWPVSESEHLTYVKGHL
jgi:hypothetical protein